MRADYLSVENDFFNHAPKFLREQYTGIVAVSGRHSVLEDTSGRLVFDFASGGFGSCVDEVVRKVQRQQEKMALSNRIMVSRRLAELVLKLNQITPPELSVSYVCNSGEEAFDASLKLAKGLNPKRDTLVVVKGSQPGSLSYGLLCSGLGAKLLDALPLKTVFVEPNDTTQLNNAINNQTLAVVYEPILSQSQCIRLTSAYLSLMQELCNDRGSLMIAYELRTGLGFSGALLPSCDGGVIPDVVVLGNALSGGVIPVGAYVTRQEINNRVYGRKNPSLHGSTTGGNPASCTAAIAALDYIIAQRLPERHIQIGTDLKLGLDRLASKYGIQVGQPEGSFIDIFLASEEQALALWRCLLDEGLLLARPNSARLLVRPALTTTLAEMSAVLQIFSLGFAKLSEKLTPEAV